MTATFVCEAKKGAKLQKCHSEMDYDTFVKHLFKHHKQNQYKCQLDGCKHKKAYDTVDALALHHWEKDCNAFSETYKLCKNCGIQKIDNSAHDCIKNLKVQIEDLNNQYESEIERFNRLDKTLRKMK